MNLPATGLPKVHSCGGLGDGQVANRFYTHPPPNRPCWGRPPADGQVAKRLCISACAVSGQAPRNPVGLRCNLGAVAPSRSAEYMQADRIMRTPRLRWPVPPWRAGSTCIALPGATTRADKGAPLRRPSRGLCPCQELQRTRSCRPIRLGPPCMWLLPSLLPLTRPARAMDDPLACPFDGRATRRPLLDRMRPGGSVARVGPSPKARSGETYLHCHGCTIDYVRADREVGTVAAGLVTDDHVRSGSIATTGRV